MTGRKELREKRDPADASARFDGGSENGPCQNPRGKEMRPSSCCALLRLSLTFES